MATKNQWRRHNLKAMFVATVASTATRDTRINDFNNKLYSKSKLWYVSNAHLSLNWMGAHADVLL